jgi:hypothetical protein
MTPNQQNRSVTDRAIRWAITSKKVAVMAKTGQP